MKQKYIKAHMKAASVYAELSSAVRLHVGCVIVKDNTIIGIGYNGMPSGWDNNCEELEYVLKSECQQSDDWMKKSGYTETAHGWSKLHSKPEVLHAETNAIAKVSRSTNSSDGASLFVTHAPCLECAKIIHQAGIKEVYYKNDYRSQAGIDFLKKCEIQVIKCNEE
jgi:dCMP deaminase